MATLTLGDLDDALYEQLRRQPLSNRRSIEAEARSVLAQGVMPSREQVLREAEAIRRSLVGRYTGDPIDEIRNDRDSR